MARDNYSYQKHRRELAKKKKKEEKIQRKLAKKNKRPDEIAGLVSGNTAAVNPNQLLDGQDSKVQ